MFVYLCISAAVLLAFTLLMKAVIRKCCQELRADFADVFGTIIEILFIPIFITLFVIVDYYKNFFWCVFYFRTAGWWSLCGGVVTTATPNTFRPYLGWSCTMHSCGPETWKTIGLCPLNQPAHGVTSGASTLKANWREKEREIYWETKREKDRTIREIKSKRQTERESCNSVPSGL